MDSETRNERVELLAICKLLKHFPTIEQTENVRGIFHFPLPCSFLYHLSHLRTVPLLLCAFSIFPLLSSLVFFPFVSLFFSSSFVSNTYKHLEGCRCLRGDRVRLFVFEAAAKRAPREPTLLQRHPRPQSLEHQAREEKKK